MALTVREFLDRLERSDILDAASLAAVRSSVSDDELTTDAEPVVKRLHKQKTLTNYQVQALWKGKGHKLSFGNYVIESELGRGGMGVVLKARHKRMQRNVAIKVLPTAMVKDGDAIARFQREVVAAAQLTHTNIVGAHDADEVNGQHILVMEFVDGRDLSEVVKKKGPLKIPEAVDYITQAARGLEFAHKQGVIHRDIKPANLLLAKDGTVKILDMGLARMAESADVGTQAELTGTGTVMGTVDYMSPEQAMSTKSADERSDIYSLGISLYYLLTRKPAYEGDSLMARLMAHANQPIPSLREARPEVPEALQQVFEKMVAKDAGQRYQTMTEVIADLDAALTDAPASGASTDPAAFAETGTVGRSELSEFLSGIDASSTASDLSMTATRVTSDEAENTVITGGGASDTLLSGLPPATQVKRKGGGGRKKKRQQWYEDKRIRGGAGGVLILLIGLLLIPGGDESVDAVNSDPAAADTSQSALATPNSSSSSGEVIAANTIPPNTIPGSAEPPNGLATRNRLSFAEGSRVDIPSLKLSASDPVTIEAYVHLNSEPVKNASGGPPEYRVANFGGLIALSRAKLGPRPIWKARVETNGGGVNRSFATDALSGHIAIVYDGQDLQVFFNGVPSDAPLTKNDGSELIKELSDVREYSFGTFLGKVPSHTWATTFDGELSEIRISKIARYSEPYQPNSRLEADEHTLALYDFHEGSGDILHDISGNGHDGKIIGAEWVGGNAPQSSTSNSNFAGNRSGPALKFTRPSERVFVDAVPLDFKRPFTVEGWFQLGDFLRLDTPNNVAIRPIVEFGPLQLRFQREDSIQVFLGGQATASEGRAYESYTGWLPERFEKLRSEPSHLAIVYTGSEAKVFLDGARIDMTRTAGQFVAKKKLPPDLNPQEHLSGLLATCDVENDLLIGAGRIRETASFASLEGTVSSIRISQSAVYTSRFTPKLLANTPSTVALYAFREGSGDILHDTSGNGHDGKIIGAQWGVSDSVRSSAGLNTDSEGTSRKSDLSRSGTALRFYDAGDRVALPDMELDLRQPFTAEVWCTPDDESPSQFHRNVVFEVGPVQLNFVKPRSGNRLECAWRSNVYRYGPDEVDGLVVAYGSDRKTEEVGRTHAAIQWDGSLPSLYINGNLVPQSTDVIGTEESVQEVWQRLLAANEKVPVRIGQPNKKAHEDETCRGMIDSFRISKGVRYTSDFEPTALTNDKQTFALYKFDEGTGEILHDSSGNGHDGKIIGAKWVAGDTPRQINNNPFQTGLLFDEPEKHVDVGKIPLDLTKPFTAELWCRPTVLRPGRSEFSLSRQTAFSLGSLRLKLERPSSSAQARLSFAAIKSNKGTPGASLTSGVSFIGPFDVSAGDLMNIAVEWTGDDARIYVNGKKLPPEQAVWGQPRPEVLPFLRSLHSAKTSPNLILGAEKYGASTSDHFDGEIYQFRLSEGIRFNADFTPSKKFARDAETVVLFDFDEGSGDILKDSSGNGHDGKIIGAEWVKRHDSVDSDSATASPQQTRLEFSQPGDHVEIPDVDLNLKESFTAEIWCTPEISDDADNLLRVAFELGPVQLKLAKKSSSVGNGRQRWEWNALAYDYMRGDDGGLVTAMGGYLKAETKRTHIAIQWDGRAPLVFIDGQPASSRGNYAKGSKKPAEQIWQELLASATKAAVAIGQPIGEGRPGQSWRGTIDGFRLSKGARYSDSFVPESQLAKDAQTKLLYRFDEGSGDVLKDSSGNGRDGKIIGAEWVRQEAARSDLNTNNAAQNGLLFQTNDAFVNCGRLPLDLSKPFTVETWCELRELRGDGERDSYQTVISLGPYRLRADRIKSSGTVYSFSTRADGKPQFVNVKSNGAPALKQRTHLAGQWTGTRLELYVDGKQQIGKHSASGISDAAVEDWIAANGTRHPNPQFTIGNFLTLSGSPHPGQKYHFGGVINQVRVSRGAKYTSNFTPQDLTKDSQTVVLHRCNEGSGGILRDVSGNGHDGKIVGAEWVAVPSAIPHIARSIPALKFNKPADRVDLPQAPLDLGEPFTMEVWCTPEFPDDPAKQTQHVVAELGPVQIKITGHRENGTDSPTEWSWGILCYDQVEIGRVVATAAAIEAEQKNTHIAVQWDGDAPAVFIDGTVAERFRYPQSVNKDWGELLANRSQAALRLGGKLNRFDESWIGTIDGFRLSKGTRYSKSFVPERPTADAQTVVAYDCKEGSGDILHDSSGNGHDGKIVGAEWISVLAID